jgi:sugar phosphate isomerase/epimerase
MLSRRSFLASGLASIAVPAAALPLGLQPGIQLYTVADAMRADAPGTLKALRAIGYRTVETASLERYSAKEFRRLLDDAGLTCASCHLGVGGGDNGPHFETARALGASFIASGGLFGAIGANPATADAAAFRRMAAAANTIGGQAQKAGLSFALHNHNMEFRTVGAAGLTGFDLLLQETDPALVGIEMDVGWVRVAGADPIRYLRQHPGRFPLLHIKDFQKPAAPRTTPGGPPGAPLGQGFIDYRPIFAAARPEKGKESVRHYFVEQEPPYRSFTSLEAARLCFQYLQSLR